MSDNDIVVFSDLKEYSKNWNVIGGRIVKGYLDPTVTTEKWVVDANVDLPKLREIYLKIRGTALLIENEKIKDLYSSIADNYEEKLNALTGLHFSTFNGDQSGAEKSLANINTAAKEGQKLGIELIQKIMGDRIDLNTISEMLKEKNEEAAQ